LATKNNSSIDNTKNIIRIINAVFHPENYDAFLCINNRKDRKDFEYGNGSNNNMFWSTIADFVNDASNVDIDSFYIIEDNDDYNKYISKATLSGQQPIGCSQQTGITCKSFIENVVKIRGTIISNMGKSGNHDSDAYVYADVAIKRHHLVKTVSPFAAYYFYMLCTDHPGMDSVLKRYLGDTVKADTISLINDDNNSARTYKKNGGIDFNKFIEAIDGIGQNFESHFEVHKDRFKEQKKRYAEQKVSESSKEYCHLKLLLLN
jgi:hypothetical protein